MINEEFPVFPRRRPIPRTQVRFWCPPELYADFRKAVMDNGLQVQDVFEELMKKFISWNASGTLRIKKEGQGQESMEKVNDS